MAKSHYAWSAIFALTTLIMAVGFINSNASITGNATAITGNAVFSSDDMYAVSWIIVVSFFLLSAYMAFFYKKKPDLSPENIERALDGGLDRLKKRIRKYL